MKDLICGWTPQNKICSLPQIALSLGSIHKYLPLKSISTKFPSNFPQTESPPTGYFWHPFVLEKGPKKDRNRKKPEFFTKREGLVRKMTVRCPPKQEQKIQNERKISVFSPRELKSPNSVKNRSFSTNKLLHKAISGECI